MKYTCAILAIAASAAAQPGSSKPKPLPLPDKDGRYTLTAPGIKAQFIPYGATLTNLFVKGMLIALGERTITDFNRQERR